MNTYPRSEKLKSEKEISYLFQRGKWVSVGNLRIIFTQHTERNILKVGVSVSKKLFKHSVDRNRIKRLIRECYRLHKQEFIDVFGENVLAMVFWVSPKLPQNYFEVERHFMKLLFIKNKN